MTARRSDVKTGFVRRGAIAVLAERDALAAALYEAIVERGITQVELGEVVAEVAGFDQHDLAEPVDVPPQLRHFPLQARRRGTARRRGCAPV